MIRLIAKNVFQKAFFWLAKKVYKFFSVVNMACGSTVAQNISYHSISSFNSANHANPCKYTICPCGSNICKLRLDFQVKKLNLKWISRLPCLIHNSKANVHILVVSFKINYFNIVVSLLNNRGNCQNSAFQTRKTTIFSTLLIR